MGTNKGSRTSKFISLVLRHDPGAAGISLDAQGWAKVDELLSGLASKGHQVTYTDLQLIVSSDEKQRYSFSEDGLYIRANQGHSIVVDLGLVEKQPPDKLCHGTGRKSADLIRVDGIKKMSRQHVHLSTSYETAKTVGSRHGPPCVFDVNAKLMYNDGHKFYESKNGVWLTDFVPSKYLMCFVDTDPKSWEGFGEL